MEIVPSLPLLTLKFKNYCRTVVLLHVANVCVHTFFGAYMYPSVMLNPKRYLCINSVSYILALLHIYVRFRHSLVNF